MTITRNLGKLKFFRVGSGVAKGTAIPPRKPTPQPYRRSVKLSGTGDTKLEKTAKELMKQNPNLTFKAAVWKVTDQWTKLSDPEIKHKLSQILQEIPHKSQEQITEMIKAMQTNNITSGLVEAVEYEREMTDTLLIALKESINAQKNP